MDRRTLLFVVVSVGILLGYQELVLNRLAPPPVEPNATATASPGVASSQQAEAPVATAGQPPAEDLPAVEHAQGPTAAAAPVPGRRILVETDLYRATINTAGGRLESFKLKAYRQTLAAESPLLDLVVAAPEVGLPLGVELRGAQVWSDAGTTYQADRESISLSGATETTLELRATIGTAPVVKRFVFHGNTYPIDLTIETPPPAGLPAGLREDGPDGSPPAMALMWARGIDPAEAEASTQTEGAAALIDSKLELYKPGDLEVPVVLPGPVEWAGFEDHYFLTVAAPTGANAVRVRARGHAIESRIVSPRDATGATTTQYMLYLGPKERSDLIAAGHDLLRGLNLGWFGPISLLLLDLLLFLHRFSGNWGVDIILLTVLVKLGFWPLTRKSFESMKNMQKLQPEMARIRERYKDDSQKMNQEIMELYRRHKVNPMGGCLPMLLQIPVFFGLYQLLANTIELRQAPFGFWIHDLAAPERLELFGFGVPVLTLLLGATMFLQQRMTPAQGDPTQQRIMMFMPLVFTFMFIGFPAGLTLYWLTNNVLTIAQQWLNLRSPKTA